MEPIQLRQLDRLCTLGGAVGAGGLGARISQFWAGWRRRAPEASAGCYFVLFIWLWQAESIPAALTACGGGHCACKSGSGIRSPSRSKPTPVGATVKAPPHQTASGDVASSAPPTAGPR